MARAAGRSRAAVGAAHRPQGHRLDLRRVGPTSRFMLSLTTFEPGGAAVVIGATGGVGAALADRIEGSGRFESVHRLSRASGLDLTDEVSVAAAAETIGEASLVICATGLLHDDDMQPEKSWDALDPAHIARAFAVNATGPALAAKHFLPHLPEKGRSVFAALSARVGSIGDNRLGGWVSYRASKAALNQIIRTFAVELKRRRPDAAIVGLHPGTVATGLSEPFGKAGDKFSPAESAAHLLDVIDALGPSDSGGVFAWDGARIPD